MERFELEPVLSSALPEVAGFLHRWRSNGAEGLPAHKAPGETVGSIERRLRWLLIENPVASAESTLGYCLRDSAGAIRGLNLCFPVAFLSEDRRLLGLCSGSFFVASAARSLGFYLFKKYLSTPGYSFYFASTCNTNSSELWRSVGGYPIAHSETQYILPLRLDAILPAYLASRTSSQAAARIARLCGRSANPILRFLMRSSAKLSIEPCQDWEKLSALSHRHRSPEDVTRERSPKVLEWRYGPMSPSHPCDVYLVRDELGNEAWFSLGHFTSEEGGPPLRASVLLDAIWPRKQMSYTRIFQEILRVTASTADAVFFRWQPGLDYRRCSPCVIPRKLGAPRAFVSVPKGMPRFPPDSLDSDDTDYIAWKFQWTGET